MHFTLYLLLHIVKVREKYTAYLINLATYCKHIFLGENREELYTVVEYIQIIFCRICVYHKYFLSEDNICEVKIALYRSLFFN